MIIQYLSNVFLTVISTLGFIAVYTQIDTGTRKSAAEQRSLSLTRRTMPQIIYICLVLIALRVLYSSAPAATFWVFINLQSIIMIYSIFLVPTLPGFVIVQAVGVALYVTDGAMTLLTTPFYLLACLIIYSERWYGPFLKQHPVLYHLPPIAVSAIFWVLAPSVSHHYSLSVVGALVNFVAFVWSYLALLDYDHYQQRDQQVLAKLSREVQYDGLTRARNWTMFQRDFTAQYAQLTKQPHLALITFDIDRFKNINDQYGHLAGNQTLIAVSNKLQRYLHDENPRYQFYRTGGEEFSIILPTTEQPRAEEILLHCQQIIRDAKVYQDQSVIQISASFGLAMAKRSDGNSTAVFKRADHYLYQSKHHGRDCVTIEGRSVA